MADFCTNLAVTFIPGNTEYTDGDTCGGLLTFSTLITPGMVIKQVTLVDEDNQAEAMDLFLFDAQPSTIASNAAFAPTFADMQKVIAKVAFASASYAVENSIAWIAATGLNVPVPGTSLYGYLVLNGAAEQWTAAKSITIRLFLEE